MDTSRKKIGITSHDLELIQSVAKTQKMMESMSAYRDLQNTLAAIPKTDKTISQALGSQLTAAFDTAKSIQLATEVLKPFHEHQRLVDKYVQGIAEAAKLPDMSHVFEAINYGKQLEALTKIQFPHTSIQESLRLLEQEQLAVAKAVKAIQPQVRLPAISPVEGLLAKELFAKEVPEVTLEAVILDAGEQVEEGQLVLAVGIPWLEIYNELEKNPDFLFQFTKHPRKFEEFIAGAYKRAGFDNVVLTPASGDGGRDVIAEKTGYGAIRILDQAKAYAPGHRVPANDVRALYGVVSKDPAASKGVVTTTSEFAPGVYKEFSDAMPTRLELRAGADLLDYLAGIINATS